MIRAQSSLFDFFKISKKNPISALYLLANTMYFLLVQCHPKRNRVILDIHNTNEAGGDNIFAWFRE
jgi:hypothetical protein